MSRLNVAVLYGANATFTNTVMEHVRSFGLFSRHDVRYLSIAPFVPAGLRQLSAFDVAVLHYSFFPGLGWQLPRALQEALEAFDGLKVLFLQDEYDHTRQAISWIRQLGIGCVYSCVPPASRAQVYPPAELPAVEFRDTLTGFVPLEPPDITCPPSAERRIVLGYRGRRLHPRYGDLAREKWLIGERMREICAQRGVVADIETSEESRIYGRRWYEFLTACRATLGTESGSNVLDADGTLRHEIDAALAVDPALSYEAIHARFIGERDGAIRMNQVSPRIFEAAATRTALVLFEGEYSGAVQPEQHYIPLRKDFRNADEVLDRLADAAQLGAVTARAHADLIASGRFSYASFVKEFDACLERRQQPRKPGPSLVERIASPAGTDEAPFMAAVPQAVTDAPFKVQWLVPELREAHGLRSGMRRIYRAVRRRLG
jgi:hypothetical protein